MVPDEVLDELRRFSTPSVSNGIETFGLRGRHEGYMDGTIRCMFPELGPVVGFAATATIRALAPGEERREHHLWEHVLTVPAPRVVVVQDLDEPGGVGSFWGEVNASIFTALGCAGMATNGCVRDLDEMRALRFHAFAGSVGVSHAWVHVVDAGVPVTVGRLEVRPGDLLHGDQHGVLSIPLDVAGQLPEAIRGMESAERFVIDFCRSPDFSPEALARLIGIEPHH